MNPNLSAKCTLWVTRGLFISVCALGLGMSRVLDWYQGIRPLGLHGAAAIFFAYYLCMPPVLFALISMEALVRNILRRQVFVRENVRRIRRMRWCCAAVSAICLPAAYFYPPLIFMTVIMAFLALTVSVVKNVMAAAVELREENDLTV